MRVFARLAGAAALALVAAAPAAAKNDKVVFVDGRPDLTDVDILEETVEEVRVRGGETLASREVLRILHGEPPPSYARGESALYAGQYQIAVEAFRAAETEAGAEWAKPYAIYHRAEALRRWGAASDSDAKLDEAAELYRRLLAEHANHFLYPAARYGLGDALLQKGDAAGAATEFADVAQRKYGDYWELWGKLGKGLCAMESGDYLAALTEFETTIAQARRPGFSELLARAQVAKGETYMARKDFDQAIRFYEDLAKRGEGQSAQATGNAYVNLARAYQQRGNEDDKRRALKTYLAVTVYYAGAPEAYAEALYEAGRLFEEEGKKDQAQALHRELKARAPGSAWAARLK